MLPPKKAVTRDFFFIAAHRSGIFPIQKNKYRIFLQKNLPKISTKLTKTLDSADLL